MLPAPSRLTASADFASTVRRSPTTVRSARRTLAVHLRRSVPAVGTDGPRVGFVVSRAVGPAVVRNRVKRRLRHLVREHWALLPAGAVVVVRALPPAAAAAHAQLDVDLRSALGDAARRSRTPAPASTTS